MEKKTLYHLTLWRFGGTLEIISDNEETGKDKLIARYKKIYRSWNAENATKAEIEEAREDIEVNEFTFNEVEDFI